MKRRWQLALQLTGGWLHTDRHSPALVRGWEVLSRFTWQSPQCWAGYLYAMGAIALGKVSEVKRFAGATAILGSGTPRGSASLGCFLQLRPEQSGREVTVGLGPGSYLFMHEYGHYRQSRLWGWLYLPLIGIPSAAGAHWTEVDANRRAARFLHQRFGFQWDQAYFPRASHRHLYCKLNQTD